MYNPDDKYDLSIQKVGLPEKLKDFGGSLLDALKSAWKTALFMEAMRNLNWSRGYLWYVEMDGVPNPFQRGGVLGLPCTSVNFTLAEGQSYSWNAGINTLNVPQSAGGTRQIQLTVMDDEQGTLRQFFERWFNQVYNPYHGVLPVTEACKQISIYFQKSTRRNVKRVYYDIDHSLSSIFTKGTSFSQLVKDTLGSQSSLQKQTDSMDFLVYPSGSLQYSLSTNQNEVITFTVTLEIAYFVNQDFGDPKVHNGIKTIFDTQSGDVSDGSGWLDKIADYI